MKWYGNMKTATKIISAFLIVSLILAGLGVYSIKTMRTMNGISDSMYGNNLFSVKELSAAQISYQRIRVNLRDMASATAASDKERFKNQIANLKVEFDDHVDNYRPVAYTQSETELLRTLDTEYQKYLLAFEEAMQLGQQGKLEVFNQFVQSTLRSQGDIVIQNLDALIAINVSLADEANNVSNSSYSKSLMITITVVVGAILLSILIGYWIARSISKPLLQMLNLASEVAGGNLTLKSDITTKDEVGQLAGH